MAVKTFAKQSKRWESGATTYATEKPHAANEPSSPTKSARAPTQKGINQSDSMIAAWADGFLIVRNPFFYLYVFWCCFFLNPKRSDFRMILSLSVSFGSQVCGTRSRLWPRIVHLWAGCNDKNRQNSFDTKCKSGKTAISFAETRC